VKKVIVIVGKLQLDNTFTDIRSKSITNETFDIVIVAHQHVAWNFDSTRAGEQSFVVNKYTNLFREDGDSEHEEMVQLLPDQNSLDDVFLPPTNIMAPSSPHNTTNISMRSINAQ
jgi:hypothetical protein